MNDFEVREVLFRSKKSKTDICPCCRVVDDTAHFLFSCVSYQEHRRSVIKELQNQNIDETLGWFAKLRKQACDKRVGWLYCKHRLILITLQSSPACLLCQFYLYYLLCSGINDRKSSVLPHPEG